MNPFEPTTHRPEGEPEGIELLDLLEEFRRVPRLHPANLGPLTDFALALMVATEQ